MPYFANRDLPPPSQKINSLIDSKTRFIDALDRKNIEQNKQYNIESPKPINNFQDLISSIITPKITAITSKIGSLSGSLLGGASGGSGSNGDHGNGSGGAGGLGGVVSSLLKLSGPILTSSAGGSSGTNTNNVSDEDDDFN